MAYISCLKTAWDALTQADRDAVSWAAEPATGVWLGQPAEIEAADGDLYCVWDDHRLTEDHALAVAAAIEGA